MNKIMTLISVPIWGLFNLTYDDFCEYVESLDIIISVPIWGLFNLTVLFHD